jgi:D-alanyl-D-alanine carboxypeptidase (penicillin-binding protein 5/6)
MTFNERWQTLILAILIIISVSLTKIRSDDGAKSNQSPGALQIAEIKQVVVSSNLAFNREPVLAQSLKEKAKFSRKWDVLDPQVEARAVLIKSVESNDTLFSFRSDVPWPAASLVKLLSAVVVIEEVGLNKKIPISRTAVMAAGDGGDLRAGEIYTSRDLLKIMLLTSSNDAAAAFEEYVGGKNYFVKLLNQKAEQIGMKKTILHDASGLNDANETTAEDMFKLAKYILEKHSDIFAWTRLGSFLVQPIEDSLNELRNRTILNINSLVNNPDFLGGKTGTSQEALQNLVAVFSLDERNRVIAVLLGSPNRNEEIKRLLEWIKTAYE